MTKPGDRLRGLKPESRWRLPEARVPRPYGSRPGWSPNRWAVVGGSGFVGGAIVEVLGKRGLEVGAVAAPRMSYDPWDEAGPIPNPSAQYSEAIDALAGQLTGAEVVVNAAGLATPDASASPALYGANSLLPTVVAAAAGRAGAGRVIHLSSVAVQGDRAVLDSSTDVKPFSPYSHSKAYGERLLLALEPDGTWHARTDVLIVRATSVQGAGRRTTRSLQRMAASRLSSVAAPGDYPSVVSSSVGLAEFVHEVGTTQRQMEPIQLQPWEGLNVSDVLRLAGGRDPLVLPQTLCRALVKVGKALGRMVPLAAGTARRLELMWFGQAQETSIMPRSESERSAEIRRVLRSGVEAV